MQIREALRWGHETLLLSSDSARLDAEVLLSHVLKKPVTFLLAHNEQKICSFLHFGRNDKTKLIFFPLWQYKRLIYKRKKGMPVAYLTGHKEFFFLDFEVNKNVLIPRPDTEILVEAVIDYIKGLRTKDYGLSPILLDIGTGSGCIPISVCKNVKGVEAIAMDVSSAALRVAKRNVKKHKLTSRITLVLSDLLKNIPPEWLEDREVIVTANLPYIPAGFQVSPDLAYEPPISLYGGTDGMEVYRRLTDQVRTLKPRALFFELFDHQIALLKTKLPDYRLKYVKDMSGEARVLVMERK
ncbi:peptide chain release factor N(5)-glutamine methyltransferase [Candidatus Peregrinibacteria bacterium]|nr:peptide chain release factor N(5)-glutamine methyltransferase [Candidatus Peregrinibacteria bacterium]